MAGRPSSRIPTEFGKKLIELREAAGLSQTALADLMGVSQTLVTYYERRGGNPTLEFITKAAAALGATPEALVGAAVEPLPQRRGRPSDFELKMKERVEKLRRLPKNKQRFVLGMIDAAIENASMTSSRE